MRHCSSVINYRVISLGDFYEETSHVCHVPPGQILPREQEIDGVGIQRERHVQDAEREDKPVCYLHFLVCR